MILKLFLLHLIILKLFAINSSESSLYTEENSLPAPTVKGNKEGKQLKPVIIAHRGASGMYPEHTKLAYRYTKNTKCLICIHVLNSENPTVGNKKP